MRRHCAFLLACSLCVLASALGREEAAAGPLFFTRPSETQSVLEATYVCGMSNGTFGCRYDSGAGVQHGKNATPGATNVTPSDDAPEATTGGGEGAGQEVVKPGEHACPPGYKVLAVPTQSGYCEPSGTPEAANPACPHGMVGTSPNDCHCPKNSELLGGNCVHYSATCSNGLAADVTPQPCAGADEKLACKMRQDGLKDCCCLTYDKE
jgi:hypothetical protein